MALGLMFQGVVNSVLTMVSASMTEPWPDVYGALTPFSSCVCVSVWIYYFMTSEKHALALYDSDVTKIIAKYGSDGGAA
jgi:hypothetical protein